MVKSTVTSLIKRFALGHLTPWSPVPPGICGATELCRNETAGVCPEEGSKEARKEENFEKFAAWCRAELLRKPMAERSRVQIPQRTNPLRRMVRVGIVLCPVIPAAKVCGVVQARDTSTKPTVVGSSPTGGKKLP